MARLHTFALGFRATILVAALVVGVGAAQAAADRPTEIRSVVALAYEPGQNVLLKAYPHALYATNDDGKNWRQIAIPALQAGEIASVAASPAANGVMYVAGPGLGVLRSEDDGKTWVARNDGLPTHDVIAVAAHTTQPDTLYSVVKESGVYRSQDGGKTWRLMDRSVKTGIRQLIHSNMAGSMQTGWLFAATRNGVRRAMDCFCLWQDAGKLGAPVRSIAYDPRQPKHMFAATGKGFFRSSDGGENWVQIMAPVSDIAALAIAPSGTLYAIGADGTLFRGADAARLGIR
jgi:photosystem II stability/assembly factor-like uncharacterized protein